MRPKLHLTDTGLAVALLGKSAEALARPTDPATGPLLESFAAAELAKQISWSSIGATLHYVRESDGHEVDIVLEHPDGSVVAVEVKASPSPRGSDMNGLRWLRDRLDAVEPGLFRRGILAYSGQNTLPMGDRLSMMPLAALWSSEPGAIRYSS